MHQYGVLMHLRRTKRNGNCKEYYSTRAKSSVSFHIKLNREVAEVRSTEVTYPN